MYENITFDSILQRMLDKIPATADKREGSVIYDALAPCAAELQLMYIELDTILKDTFADTAPREFLIRRARERGIVPYPASTSAVKAQCTPVSAEIPVGSRFSLNELNFAVTEKISEGVYRMECETPGAEGNNIAGSVIPVDYIEGLESVVFTELLIPGENEEDTESLRRRYFSSFDAKAYGGNKADYIEKVTALSGVGAAKVTPAWNGGGTVKVTILNSRYSAPSAQLIDRVQEVIDPLRDGSGDGLAPIGHVVTVDAPAEVPVNISLSIVTQGGASADSLLEPVKATLDNYLLTLRGEWGSSDGLTVRISKIENALLSVEGILDVSDTAINGGTGNFELGGCEIPVLGSVIIQ